MKLRLFLFFFLICFSGYSQELQQEINKQVWIPFIKAFVDLNTEAFMAVHSKDVVRSPRDSKAIYNFEQYKKQNEKSDQRSKDQKLNRSIELRFLERIASESQAYEIGIYKTTITNEKGERRNFYGKFHVVLRKENSVWKILVDSDSSEGNTIGEKHFQEAKPML